MGDKDNLPELPQGWLWIFLDDILSGIEAGKSFKCEERPPSIDEVGVVKVSAVSWGEFDESQSKTCTDINRLEPRFLIKDGDFLFSRANTIELVGACVIVQRVLGRVMLSDKILRFHIVEVPLKWVLFVLRSRHGRDEIERLATGNQDSMRNIGQDRIRRIRIPLPPLTEQHRIVAKIDELFSELDAGVELLKKLKAKLKRYRQSVLKAAVEGKLTKDWREAHQGELEPASVLLERILKERREKWEAEQLAQMKAKGKTPKDDSWKLKYKEPVTPDTFDLPELPEGWEWISLDYVLSKIEAGKSFKCEERTPTVEEVGVVKVSAVTWGEFNEFESKTCLDLDRINPQLFVKEGDFLFSRANTIELVGACVIAKHVTRRVMLSDKILRFYFVEVPPRWVLFALRTRLGRNEIERLSTGNQESMRNIGQERIRRIRIFLPPVQEIQQIVSELERRFSVTDELEKVLNQNLKRAEKLRQSILKKAFEGKLVPQDSTDEPADKLLERIKAEKAKREAEAKAKKKRKQPGKSQQLELF